jgi:hypothetical protein
MSSQVIHQSGYKQLPAGVNDEGEDVTFPDLQYRVVRLSERHSPDESEYHDVKIWNAVPGHPVNRNVELMRHNSNQGVSKFGLTRDEAEKLVVGFLESLSDEEYAALLAQVERT